MVSPTIRNLKVTKMLVDGRAGLNLILPVVIKTLQIPDGDLEETGTFQGVNPGRSQPKGKVMLPMTFVGELNHRMERIIFYTADHPDRTTAAGCLPLLVSPTIRNLKVKKMLVDGGAGLNLISPAVIEKL